MLIDEASMLRPDTSDAIDLTLQVTRKQTVFWWNSNGFGW